MFVKNVVILHGTDGSPQGNWFPWLKKELEKHNFKTCTPQLPDANYPDAKKYTHFLMNLGWDFNSETILVGHSSGSVAALQLLQALPRQTIVKAVISVAACKDNLQWRDEEKKLKLQGLFEPELDYLMIRKKARKFIFIHSTDDPYCPPEHASYLAVKLQGELFMMTGEKHFNTETGDKYKEFPFLLEKILAL